MSPGPHDARVDQLYVDMYLGKDAQNPSMTSRMKSVEEWRIRVEIAEKDKKDRLNTKLNILITAALGLLAAIIANHFKIV